MATRREAVWAANPRPGTRRACPADRVVQELRPSSRARCRYAGRTARLGHVRTRLGAAVALYRMRGAGCRFRGERREAVKGRPSTDGKKRTELVAVMPSSALYPREASSAQCSTCRTNFRLVKDKHWLTPAWAGRWSPILTDKRVSMPAHRAQRPVADTHSPDRGRIARSRAKESLSHFGTPEHRGAGGRACRDARAFVPTVRVRLQ
jgi:hypothetical protein